MPRFSLVDGDVTVLTSVFNSLREGMGTTLGAGVSLEAFLESWKASPSAFASESGFFAIVTEGQPKGAGTAVLCQFQSGAIEALFGEQLWKLSREILKAMNLVVIRAVAQTDGADRLMTLAGFTRDGVIRKALPDERGMLQDIGMYSLTRDDLEAEQAEPLNGVSKVEEVESLDLFSGAS